MSSSSLVWYPANNFGHSLDAAVILNENVGKWNAGKKWEARFNAFFLILPEIFLTFKYAFIATVLAPFAVIKIPISFFVIWAWDKDSSAMKIHKEEVGIMLFGEAVFKTIVCAFNILWSPILGFMSPIENLTYHERIGALSLSRIKDIEPSKPALVKKLKMIGSDDLKKQIMDQIIIPFRYPDLYAEYAINPPSRSIFYGPDSDVKLYQAQALAEELDWVFIQEKTSFLIGQTLEITQNNINFLFNGVINHKNKGCVIYIEDDFCSDFFNEPNNDASSELSEEVRQFKKKGIECLMDGIDKALHFLGGKNVLAIASIIDSEKVSQTAFARVHFDLEFIIPMLDVNSRKELFEINLKSKPLYLRNIDCTDFADRSTKFSPEDIQHVVSKSCQQLLQAKLKKEPLIPCLNLEKNEEVVSLEDSKIVEVEEEPIIEKKSSTSLKPPAPVGNELKPEINLLKSETQYFIQLLNKEIEALRIKKAVVEDSELI